MKQNSLNVYIFIMCLLCEIICNQQLNKPWWMQIQVQ